MSLRKRVVKGFTDAYLRTERSLVVDLLREGKITQEDWQDIARELNNIADKYTEDEISHSDFLKNRKEIEKRIATNRSEPEEGLTGKDAINLYESYRKKHQPVMEKALHESDRNTFYFLYRLPVVKTRYMLTGLRLQ